MNWYENWYDYTGTCADWVMAGAAIYVAKFANDWKKESHYKEVKDFRKLMTKVNNELLQHVMRSDGGDLEIILAMKYFNKTDEAIDIMKLYLTQSTSEELQLNYNQFKINQIKSWREAKDFSQQPDHEYTSYPDFYKYLSTLKLH